MCHYGHLSHAVWIYHPSFWRRISTISCAHSQNLLTAIVSGGDRLGGRHDCFSKTSGFCTPKRYFPLKTCVEVDFWRFLAERTSPESEQHLWEVGPLDVDANDLDNQNVQNWLGSLRFKSRGNQGFYLVLLLMSSWHPPEPGQPRRSSRIVTYTADPTG